MEYPTWDMRISISLHSVHRSAYRPKHASKPPINAIAWSITQSFSCYSGASLEMLCTIIGREILHEPSRKCQFGNAKVSAGP